MAEFIYAHLHQDKNWYPHTVLHLVPLNKRDDETQERYYSLARAIIAKFEIKEEK